MPTKFVLIPISQETLSLLAHTGFARHVRVNRRGKLRLPITMELFRECCRQQNKGETIEDVIVRALAHGAIQ